MNLLQLQAEFARQWLDLASSMASTAVATANMLSEQMASGWTRSLSGADSQPNMSWPFNVWQGLSGPTAGPSLPFANPFLAPAVPAFWPFPGWMGLPGWKPPGPLAMAFAAPVTVTWTWPWTNPWPAMPWFSMGSQPSTPGTDLIEQVAASYRTASGYAVAAIMGPFGTALDPRTFGQPWWQTAPKRGLLN